MEGGTINVSHILTGECVAKIADGDPLKSLQVRELRRRHSSK